MIQTVYYPRPFDAGEVAYGIEGKDIVPFRIKSIIWYDQFSDWMCRIVSQASGISYTLIAASSLWTKRQIFTREVKP